MFAMQQTMSAAAARSKPRSRNWLILLDIAFYLVLTAFLVALFYYFYSYRSIIVLDVPFMLQGAVTTIVLSVTSMILATIFGFIGALGRIARFPLFRWIALVYVEVVRGTPILVQLFFWGFVVSGALNQIGFNPWNTAFQLMTALQNNSIVPGQVTFNAAFYGILGLSFNYGAYLTEVFRTGIATVDKGQTEAALSLGMTGSQTMRKIVLPQAFRITIPPFANYFITLVQDSALLSTLGGVIELQLATASLASPLSSSPFEELFVYVLGAVIFLAICYPLALLARYLEGRFAMAY
jgi:His/Glu/Gln/Arg/opine family amino acid ABC transporter permease subunit